MRAARDEHIDVAKGLGILFVIGGHCGFGISDFRAYSFHMPLFYFISGFFLNKYMTEAHFDRAAFLYKKARALLLPYFLYNVFFGIVTYLQQFIGITYQEGDFFDILSFHNLFIEPFLDGHQFQISCPLWFVPSLFSVFVIFALLRNVTAFAAKNIFSELCHALFLVGVYYACVNMGALNENIYLKCLGRTLVGYCFCMFGMLSFKYRTTLNSTLLLIVCAAVYAYCSIRHGTFGYLLLHNTFGSGIGKDISLIISLSGIGIILSLSNIIVQKRAFVVPQDLAFLGRNSFHIMAIHLSAFLVLNIGIALLLPDKHLSDIEEIYFRYPKIAWAYFFFSVYFSYSVVKLITKIKTSVAAPETCAANA